MRKITLIHIRTILFVLSFLFSPPLSTTARAAAADFAVASPANGITVYYIDPGAATNGNGTIGSPYNTWTSVKWTAGNTYLQKAGTAYNSQLLISRKNGASGSPIVLGSYGTGAKPVIHNLFFGHLAYFSFQNLSFPYGVNQNSTSPEDHVTFDHVDISNPSGPGLFLSGTSTNEVVSNSTIHDVNGQYDCVSLSMRGNNPGQGVQFLGNAVYNCGIHGITVWTSYATISGNVVHGTGQHPGRAGGGSGIHVFNGCFHGTPCGTEGHDNVITGNVTYDANDNQGDGNGIQVDQATAHNNVSNNLSFFNDGQGISIFESHDGTYDGNVTFNNGMDRQHGHSLFGDMDVDDLNMSTPDANNTLTNNTLIISNVGASNRAGPFGFDVVTAKVGANTWGNNHLLIADPTNTQEAYYRTYPTPNNNQATWNAGAGFPSKIIHASPDTFGSVTLHKTSGAPPMDFVLPTQYQIPVAYNGQTVTLYGWRVDSGLYATFLRGAGG